MSKEKIEIDEIKKGLGVIANVMLLGRLVPEDCKGISHEKMIDNYKNLCEMTEVYTRTLVEEATEAEMHWQEDHVKAKNFEKLRSVGKVS